MTVARLVPLLALALLAGPSVAQAPLTLVNPDTRVATVTYEGQGPILEENLREVIATAAPQVSAIGRFLSLFPGGKDESVFLFSPVELAKDVVRLQRYYAASGFPLAAVDYDVALDTADNAVDVTFLIERGPPLLIDEVTFAGPGQAPVTDQLAPELHGAWEAYVRGVRVQRGTRLDQTSLVDLQSRTVTWLANRGYAFADAGAERFRDPDTLEADVRVKVNAGPRARVTDITLETLGDSAFAVDRAVVLRELPFDLGDRYDASELIDGQRQIFGLGMFQLALVNPTPGQPRDSTVDVRVQVRQGNLHSLTGYTGYATEGGVTLRGQYTYRNFLGGARSITPSFVARTGVLGTTIGVDPNVTSITDYQASVTLRQPYVLDTRFAATATALYRQRNDRIERSDQTEGSASLVFSRSALQTASLTAFVNARTLLASRVSRLSLLSEGSLLNDSTSLSSTTTGLELGATYGRVDDPLTPRRGFVLRPSGVVAGGLGDLSFGRGRLSATALYPFNDRVGLVARLTGGALAPYGGTDLSGERDYLLLRERLFYAGGTNDVRGWGEGLLGPKVFDFDTARIDSFDIAATYFGVGGQGKVSGSVQLNLPLPLGPQWGANVFLDAGRVFTPATAFEGLISTDALYEPGEPIATGADDALADFLDLYRAEGGVRAGAGAGLQYLTPVGFVSVALGVKLNPSYFDLRPAESGPALLLLAGFAGIGPSDLETEAGLEAGQACLDAAGFTGPDGEAFDLAETLDPSPFRRLQFHLSLGQTF